MSDPNKIAFIEQDSGIGGAEVNLFYLLQGMDRRLFHPVVVVPCEGPLTDRLKVSGFRFQVIPRPKLISTSAYFFGKRIFNPLAALYDVFVCIPAVLKIKRFLIRERIEVVHTNSMVAHIYGAVAAKLAGVPCVWHMQDIVDSKTAFGLFRIILSFIAGRLPAKIAAVSKAVASMFPDLAGERLRVVYNGVDTDIYSPVPAGDRIRSELGIPEADMIVGIVGRLVRWKGHREFLEAAAVVAARVPRVRFLIVGDTTFGSGKYREELASLSEKLGISSKVTFTGFRPDVPRLLAGMDVLVHASTRPEPFGLVVVEGMAAAVPVIASVHGAANEIIDDGEDGFLVDPADTQALAGIMIKLLEDAPLRKRIGSASRRKAVENYSIARFINQMEEVYTDAAG